jgi:hypothetical protein
MPRSRVQLGPLEPLVRRALAGAPRGMALFRLARLVAPSENPARTCRAIRHAIERDLWPWINGRSIGLPSRALGMLWVQLGVWDEPYPSEVRDAADHLRSLCRRGLAKSGHGHGGGAGCRKCYDMPWRRPRRGACCCGEQYQAEEPVPLDGWAGASQWTWCESRTPGKDDSEEGAAPIAAE